MESEDGDGSGSGSGSAAADRADHGGGESKTNGGMTNDDGEKKPLPLALPLETPSPSSTKGKGLKKWRRIQRREIAKEAATTTPEDLNRFLKRDSSGGSAFALVADSDNSEDPSSKSSTAASAPKFMYHHRNSTSNRSPTLPTRNTYNNTSARYSQPGGRQNNKTETTKKPRGGVGVKIDKDASYSSVESDLRSSNVFFTEISNGRHISFDVDNCSEAQASDQQSNEYLFKDNGEEEVVSQDDDPAADASWEAKEEQSDIQPPSRHLLAESIILLQDVHQALEKATEMATGKGKESSSSKQPSGKPANDGIPAKRVRRNPKKLPKDGNAEQKTLPNPPNFFKDVPVSKDHEESLEKESGLIARKRKHDDYVTVDKDGNVVKNPPKKKVTAAWVPSFQQLIPIEATSNSKTVATAIVKTCLLPADVRMHEEQTSKDILGATFRSIQQISASLAVIDDRRICDEQIVKNAEEVLKQHSALLLKVKNLEVKTDSLQQMVTEKDAFIDKMKEDYIQLESQFENSNRLAQELAKSKEEFKEEFVQEHLKELNSKYVFFTHDAWKEMKSEFDIPSDSDNEGEIPQTPTVDGVSNVAGGEEPTGNEDPAIDEAAEVQS